MKHVLDASLGLWIESILWHALIRSDFGLATLYPPLDYMFF